MSTREAGTGGRSRKPSRRYDTTPTDDERADARRFLTETAGDARDRRAAYALGWLGGLVDELTEAVDEEQARCIARARAVHDAYREGPA
jgi:hypothetical protein